MCMYVCSSVSSSSHSRNGTVYATCKLMHSFMHFLSHKMHTLYVHTQNEHNQANIRHMHCRYVHTYVLG